MGVEAIVPIFLPVSSIDLLLDFGNCDSDGMSVCLLKREAEILNASWSVI